RAGSTVTAGLDCRHDRAAAQCALGSACTRDHREEDDRRSLLARSHGQGDRITLRPTVVLQAQERCRMSAIAVDVINDYDTFSKLEPEWNDTVDRAGLTHPFLRHEWLRSWWDSFGAGGMLNIMVVRAGQKIIALAPLM